MRHPTMTPREQAEAIVLGWATSADPRPSLGSLADLAHRIEVALSPVAGGIAEPARKPRSRPSPAASPSPRAKVDDVTQKPKASKSTCSVTGCDRKVGCRGMCWSHYEKDRVARKKAEAEAAATPKVGRASTKGVVAAVVGKPTETEGGGDRRTDCKQYNTCLEHVRGLKWRGFTCSSCPLAKGAAA